VPEKYSKLLLERYRNYGNSEMHKNAFHYFATRILPAVNASQSKYDKRKYTLNLSECFTYTDEAFGLLMVVNYEQRWDSQHHAVSVEPAGAGRDILSKHWVDANYTSATEGSRQGVSWSNAGLVKFNELSEMVQQQREEDTGKEVEEELITWCRSKAGMTILNRIGGATGEVDDDMHEEDEVVEAVGECDIFAV
jgi:hypothetical protein